MVVRIFLILGIIASGAVNIVISKVDATELVTFNRDIRPILSDRCFVCHGPDSGTRQADLRLDDPQSALAELASGAGRAWVAGKPEESVAFQRISSHDNDERMPPPDSGLGLTAAEQELIRKWILSGARYETHWAFVPPQEIDVPTVHAREWPINEIDCFVLARLEKDGIDPSPAAEKWRWLRRVTLDLTGLPPELSEIEAFVRDDGADAYERVVDRLLASPQFGERMAIPWLDVVRYADSYGYQSDLLCHVWPYRDWLIQALNDNLPFDQFLMQQIGGDLLPGKDRKSQSATAFNRLHRQTNEGGSIEEEFRVEYVADRVQTFGTAVLGLTFECTKCHDHKYDPLTQRDFYGLAAFFNSIDEHGTYNDSAHTPSPSLLLPTSEQEAKLRELDQRIDDHKLKEPALRAERRDTMLAWIADAADHVRRPQPVGKWGMATETVEGQVRLKNEIQSDKPGTFEGGNTLVRGITGQEDDPALQCSGDDGISLPISAEMNFPERPFSLSIWLWRPESLVNGSIWHAQAGTDAGFHGTECQLVDGKVRLAIVRFWPGDVLAAETEEPIPSNTWLHLCTTYDGSGDAAGLRIFVDGHSDQKVVKNYLPKRPGTAFNTLTFAAKFRAPGLTGGRLDDIQTFDRELSAVEIRLLANEHQAEQVKPTFSAAEWEEHYFQVVDPVMAEWRGNRQEFLKQRYDLVDTISDMMTMREMAEPRSTYVLDRGDYTSPKTEDRRVERSTPRVLNPWRDNWPKDRYGLALWTTDRDNPLTARVAVNRVWMIFFGRGLVETQENFGIQGTLPSHPELLDWLACDFQSHGWNLKRLCKQIALSATYRQTSRCSAEKLADDPDNARLARGPRRRLSGESLRDLALSASGLLDKRIGGPPVSPYQPPGLWRETNQMTPEYQQGVGGDLYRRSLYTVWKRTAPAPSLMTFDVPGREVCVARRSFTQTPLQALIVLNDVQFVEAARNLAQRALQLDSADSNRQLDLIHQSLAGRLPTDAERSVLADLLAAQRHHFANHPQAAAELISIGESVADKDLNIVELAALTDICQIVLNSDATLWQR